MAKSEVMTARQQTQQSQPQPRQQDRRVATRQAWDLLGFPLAPFSLLGLNPFSLMGRLMEQMDYVPRATASGDGTLPWIPAIEVSEKDGRLVVRADLPGLKPDEIRVEVRDGVLVIEGENRMEQEEDRGGFHRTERRYGTFLRSIPLPESAKIDQVSATLNNGVLEITVPVEAQQASSQRQIPVQSASEGSPQNAQNSSENTNTGKPAEKSA